jgi:hypothetical protein
LARNPLYILSAALLLWSMRRLSLDSRIFSHELPQLLFNFSSFQFYELLLAVTAIALARHRVWYDSGLLVALENLFVCVPFLLVSQALLLENGVAFALCLAGCLLALVRVGALKRWLAALNMPASLLWSGTLLLCFNLGWPLLIRLLHKDLSSPAWDERGLTLTSLGWNWIIPGAVALAALLPGRPSATSLRADEEAPFYAWRSFPLLTLFCWIAGTCVHLYCISYVYGLPWRADWLAPALWVAGWMLWRHAGNLAPERARVLLQRILLFPPALAALAFAGSGRWMLCLTLAICNAVACGALAVLRRDRLAAHLCGLSALLACAFLPHPTAVVHGNPVAPAHDLDFAPLLLGGGLLYIVGWALYSARPKVGIAGGLFLALGLGRFLPTSSLTLNLALQAGLIFILLHSIRWNVGDSADMARARKLCGLYWLLHTMIWVAVEPAVAINATIACGVFALEVYALARLVLRQWGSRVIAASALAVIACGPCFLGGRQLLRAPDGVLALLGSFALFALGTLAAFMKSHAAGESKSHKWMVWRAP